MLLLYGNPDARIDAKGRVFVPSVFRKQLQTEDGQCLILRKDVFQDCLVLYPQSVWQSTLKRLRERLNQWDPRQQNVFRQFVSSAEILPLDSNGRILIPKRYLQMAHIVSEVRFIGMNDTIEVWARERADEPFMDPGEFTDVLQKTIGSQTLE